MINEKVVAGLWRSGRISSFVDDLGNHIEIICPGRSSTRAGCDFQDVVMMVNGGKAVGDVEVHISSDLWRKHGHDRDAAYNGVILHVSMWQHGKLPVRLQDGRNLSTVILSQYINVKRLRRLAGCPGQRCGYMAHRRVDIDKILLSEGRQRLENKSARFAAALLAEGAEQVLYKGICRALGYSRNMTPFETLADRMPVEFIIKHAVKNRPGKQALLTGAAGLLPSQSGLFRFEFYAGETAKLEKEWSAMGDQVRPMRLSDWCFTFVRPVNNPVRRLAALSYLLQRYEEEGLLAGLRRMIYSIADEKGSRRLEDSLMVSEYYSRTNRYDFDLYQRNGATLIGKGRAGEIVMNILVPFFTAFAKYKKDGELEDKVIKIYTHYAALPGNELTAYMKDLLLRGACITLDACRQQGLLHIYHCYCRVKDCARCPVFKCRRPARA